MRSSAHRPAAAPLFLLMLAVFASPTIEAAGQPRLPKGVKATRLDDGAYTVVAKASASPPVGDEVLRLDARGLLEAAATRLCPDGHDLEIDDGPRLSIDPSGRFTTTMRGTVRCRPVTPVDAAPQARTGGA
jgi:hypothetical protein